jgi:hypothetical protein
LGEVVRAYDEVSGTPGRHQRRGGRVMPGLEVVISSSGPGMKTSEPPLRSLGEVVSAECGHQGTAGVAVRSPGEVIGTPGEVIGTPGEVISTAGEVISTAGEVISTPGEVISTAGGPQRSVGAAIRPLDLAVRPSELVLGPSDLAVSALSDAVRPERGPWSTEGEVERLEGAPRSAHGLAQSPDLRGQNG